MEQFLHCFIQVLTNISHLVVAIFSGLLIIVLYTAFMWMIGLFLLMEIKLNNVSKWLFIPGSILTYVLMLTVVCRFGDDVCNAFSRHTTSFLINMGMLSSTHPVLSVLDIGFATLLILMGLLFAAGLVSHVVD